MKAYSVNKTDILVGRLKGRLFACNNSCPHRGASLSKGELKGENVICYMHGYEFSVFTGKLVNMKSWKKEYQWVEQTDAWRESGDLVIYPVAEKGDEIYVDISAGNLNAERRKY
jgi:nitrite reductase/ring-hydroxylating ferredoxin subunit